MPEDFKALLSTRGYVLGETAEHYGIWHRAAGDEPLERFPLTAEGFDAAEARFRELSRRRRRDPERARTVLFAIFVAASSLWVLASLLAAIMGWWAPFGVEIESLLVQVAYVLDSAAYRLALGALFVLAALYIASREPVASSESREPRSSERRWERVLFWVLLLGLAVWILSALATRTLEGPSPPEFFARSRSEALFIVAWLVETIAFRAWIAAAVLLALARLFRLRAPASP